MTTPLITRLEEAAEGSRELDLRVFEHFDRVNGERWTEADLDYALTDPDRTINPPHLTTSIDAALALAERVLPGWDFIVGRTNGGLTIHAQVGPGEMQFGNTPALALCIAILKANHKDKP